MKIAIIGSGIAGLTAAHRLHREHDITVFEAGSYVGGHTNTVDVTLGGRDYAIDTGFIVFNERTYPNFCRLLGELGVPSQPTSMSFGVRCDRTGLEYNGTDLGTIFAQRRNLLRPNFHRMLADVVRFNHRCKALLVEDDDQTTLEEYLLAGGYSTGFIEHFLVPMGAAIWSADPEQFRAFPARVFAHFFTNHGFLDLFDQPQWRVVTGGSRQYVRRLTAPFADRIRLRSPVQEVSRQRDGVIVVARDSPWERFDRVIVATHSDQALRMLAEPTNAEREVLSAIRYRKNETILHTDTSLLPTRPKAQAAWNYLLPAAESEGPTVTYDMNLLQGIESEHRFCVTLNQTSRIDPERILRRIAYAHPIFDAGALRAQRQRHRIDGTDRIHYCGAYWGFGFHEDGVKSALRTLQSLKNEEKPTLQRGPALWASP